MTPPPPFAERRMAHRRATDRIAHEETRLLARSLDILAADRPAEDRLAGMLGLLARTAGARRAAVLSPGVPRRVAVSIGEREMPDAAGALARWLDAEAPRSRADRAASSPATIAFVVQHEVPGAVPVIRPLDGAPTHYSTLVIPGAGGAVLGFDFADATKARAVHDRLPPTLVRHAAVALALVTERLALERELAELRAGEAERSRFVSTVAHELRTPLTGLSGYLDLILGGSIEDGATERDFLERSRTIVGSMGELVSDLLELSRLESGTLGLEARPVSIHEVGAKVLNGLEPIAIHRGVGLRSDLPPRLRTAIGDRRRVEQIVTNLAGNAVKFSPVGGSVEIAGWFDGPVALVAVRDDGRGIEPEDRLRIFERFYRMSDHERVTGTGLGLPIARDLARAMGGDLGVASVPGSGSTFLLALPASTAVPADDVVTALARAMATEEMRLEERAVLRAIKTSRRDGSARPDALPLPRVLPPLDGPVVVGPRSGGSRPVRLRAIDGAMSRDGAGSGGRETREGSHSRPDTPSPA